MSATRDERGFRFEARLAVSSKTCLATIYGTSEYEWNMLPVEDCCSISGLILEESRTLVLIAWTSNGRREVSLRGCSYVD